MNYRTTTTLLYSTEEYSPVCQEEFDVLITGSRIIFSWNSQDISAIAHTLGEPDIDLEPCG
jgi:hypothetical protein